ncbi:MAG: M3 family oligoendopeptidase [Candidatus Eisenbacteria bacterium]
MTEFNPKWDLDSLYPGGSRSESFALLLEKAERDADECAKTIDALGDEPGEAWAKAALHLQALSATLSEAVDFVECLEAQDVKDSLASQLMSRVDKMVSRKGTLRTKLETRFLGAGDGAWKTFLERPEISLVAFPLNELREAARRKMDPAREILAEELSVDGYHGWGRMYEKIAGGLRVSIEERGKAAELSMGQLHNKMEDPDRAVRKQAFEKLEESWGRVAETTALALNNQAGFRLSLYRSREWESVLQEPLRINRMQRETLDVMWGVAAERSARLLPYMKEKARLLGIDRLAWYDVTAPVGEADKKFPYGEACEFILEHFGGFHEGLTEFSRHALESRWVEAEDRPGKRAGGFCTDFPLNKETRIFMTFGGTYGNVSTLGHELGHAYHTWLLKDDPFWRTRYPMALAETASTFCETIISDAALEGAASDGERLALLAIKAEEALIMMMNLRTRFVFETSFFDVRRKSSPTVDELNELMVKAQKECFHSGLEVYHPLFWASKLHFYITQMPFYNFPYVFGYLFSNGIYDRAVKEGPSFAPKYDALLRDTGAMTSEALAKKHLGADLTNPEFWEAAADRALSGAERFVELAKKM